MNTVLNWSIVVTSMALVPLAGGADKPYAPRPQDTLKPMLSIQWKKGSNLPQGFQDSAGGILHDTLVTVGGFCSGQTGVPGKAATYEGGDRRELAAVEVPELPKNYPECTMFGELPAYGFYARHVKGRRSTDVRLRTRSPDLRHALVLDDTKDVAIARLDADYSEGAAPALKLAQTCNALISGCQSRAKGGTFLQVAGASTHAVALIGNDLTAAAKATLLGPEVPGNAVSVK